MLIFLGIFFNNLQNWLREQEENQKKLFLGLPNVWGGGAEREGGEKRGGWRLGDLGRGGAISLVRQLGDRQVGASPTDIVINFVANQSC